jgi:hypothetical protein
LGANPREWRAAFDPIPAERFLLIEVWAGHRWEKVDSAAPFLTEQAILEAKSEIA